MTSEVHIFYSLSDCFYLLIVTDLRHHWKLVNEDEDEEGDGFKDPFDSEREFICNIKKLRQGLRFLKSKHARNVQDVILGNVYFVQCDMKASMESVCYKVKIAISIVSGNVKLCQCECKAQTLRRCCHVSGLLLYVWCHIRLNGYGGKEVLYFMFFFFHRYISYIYVNLY